MGAIELIWVAEPALPAPPLSDVPRRVLRFRAGWIIVGWWRGIQGRHEIRARAEVEAWQKW